MIRPTWAVVIGIILILLLIGACAFVVIPLTGSFGYPGGIAMPLFGAFILVGIVLLIVSLARNTELSSASTSRGDSALEILKARYAKGEITREQYEAMRRDLG